MSLVIGGQTGELEGGGQASWFDGMIDEVMILSKVLTEAEITKMMDNGIILAVETLEGLTTTWGNIKKQGQHNRVQVENGLASYGKFVL